MGGDIEIGMRKFVAPEIVFGLGAGTLAGRYAGNFGVRKVLVVTDNGVANCGWTDAHALEAIKLITDALPKLMKRPSDLQLRGRMMLGSLFAGLAFSNAGLGMVHAMAHSLGGLLNLPHGACNAILLEHVVAFNFDAATERYRRIAKTMGLDIESLDDEQAKNTLVDEVARIRKSVGVTSSLGDLGMTPQDIRPLAENSLADPCIVTNPVMPAPADIEKIYEQAL